MSRIYLPTGQIVADLSASGSVTDMAGCCIGCVQESGEVYAYGAKIGHVDRDGCMYCGDDLVGQMTEHGQVYDDAHQWCGAVDRFHCRLYATGAAYLMLIWPYL